MKKNDGNNFAALKVTCFDPDDPAAGYTKFHEITTRDRVSELDKKQKFRPALYDMDIERKWWTTEGKLICALEYRKKGHFK